MRKIIGVSMLTVFAIGMFMGIVADVGFIPALIVTGIIIAGVGWLYTAINLII